MQAVLCERWGDPEEVLQVRDVPEPAEPLRGDGWLGGEVRVRMLLSPINPSDLLMVQGRYGRQPPLPATPGFEGVGIVEAGRGLLARRVLGRRVAVLNDVRGGKGNWQEKVIIPARTAIPVSSALTDEQAATFFVNPASALVMVRHILQVPRGAWLLQTAAGSALGRMVIRLGKMDGFRTINAVRRREQGDELRQLGADAVICTEEENLHRRVLELTGGEGVRYAIDAVGGSTGSEVVGTLARHGRMLVYGALAGQPLTIDPRTLLVGQKKIEGFWLSEWVRDAGILRMLLLLRQLNKLIRGGVLSTEVGAAYPLEEIRQACRHAAQPGRQGKVLLRIGK